MNKATKNWVDSANYDLQTAGAMFVAGKYLYVVFMCHLAIEKMFKALLAHQYPSDVPPKIHNLITLSQRAGTVPPDNLKDFFQRMDNISIVTRYPEDMKTVTKEFNKETFKMAQTRSEIRKIVIRYLKNLRASGVPIEKAYLFGSQTQTKTGAASDIDLAIISPLFEKMSLWDRAGYLGKAAWDIPYPIDALGYSPSQVKKVAQGTLLSHILKKGIEITP